MRRQLVVNADDFGLSPGVNRGVVEAHERGIVTSTTLMVRQPAAAEAAALARELPGLGVGLHVDLGEWSYVAGEWVTLYTHADSDDAEAVSGEVAAQLEIFGDLLGRPPTHLDSHQHVHQREPVSDVVSSVAARLGVPVRGDGIAYVGTFYGQLGTGEPYHEALTVDALIEVLRGLPPGSSEIGCHPGYDDGLNTMYRHEREMELHVLCDPRVRAAVIDAGIQLVTFAELP